MNIDKLRNYIVTKRITSVIIQILITILVIAIYLLIFHFIFKIDNQDIVYFSIVICYIIGWEALNALSYYRINFVLKLLLSFIGIPIFIAFHINDIYTDHCYNKSIEYSKEIEEYKRKRNKENKYIYDKDKNIVRKANEIEKEKYINEAKNDNNINVKYENDDEYYCEYCFKKISKEEYELNDNMCEECYSEYLMLHIND